MDVERRRASETPGDAPSRTWRAARPWLALALALLTHGVAALLLHLSAGAREIPARGAGTPRPATAVAVRRLPMDAWVKNRGDTRPPAPRRDLPKEPEPRPKGQVVAVAPGDGREAPNAEFLAERSNKVERQTQAREKSAFYRNAMPQRTSPNAAPKPQVQPPPDAVESLAGAEGARGDQTREEASMRDSEPGGLELPRVVGRTEIKVKPAEGPLPGLPVPNQPEAVPLAGNSTRLRLGDPRISAPGPDGPKGALGPGGPLPQGLLPSPGLFDPVEGAAANDHLRDVEEGDGTFLNTREWKYASFFNRLKQSLGSSWNPSGQLRLRDPTGNIYWGRDRVTVLHVTLDAEGRLREAFVKTPSGLDFLDLEAMRSFDRAQPFPNPPPGLADADGLVRFTFGFHVSLTAAPGFHLFRD